MSGLTSVDANTGPSARAHLTPEEKSELDNACNRVNETCRQRIPALGQEHARVDSALDQIKKISIEQKKDVPIENCARCCDCWLSVPADIICAIGEGFATGFVYILKSVKLM